MPEPGSPNERGAALLTVLLLVAVMAVVASTALERLALATRMTGNGGAIDQARALAHAGAEVARLRIGDLVAASPGRISLRGNWLNTPQGIPLPGGMATARVTDGGNCFNLNSLVSGSSEAALTVRPTAVAQFEGLLRLLGIDARAARSVAISTTDWIDSDAVPQPGGAEDETYARAARPYRTANRFMVDRSELRAVNGMTPALYAIVRPWVCALPTADLSPINVNTLLPGQAPLIAMLVPGKIGIDQARELLARRPVDGYGSTVQFWALPALGGVTPQAEVAQQVRLTTGFFDVDLTVEVGSAQAREQALIDARQSPAILVRRSWTDAP
ncbi:MAG: type II secretion system minor pseudopilin GspK [Sphingobium sp.]